MNRFDFTESRFDRGARLEAARANLYDGSEQRPGTANFT
jgi:hypothetical protein